MPGTLYVLGIGPGDPELLTLKSARIIKESPVLCVPKGREEGSSLALSIVQRAVNLDDKEIMEAFFPMKKSRKMEKDSVLETKWNETVQAILHRLEQDADVAFLTLGDPTVYSTFFYLCDSLYEMMPDLNMEIIPGVSSINASAASAGMFLSLADEKIAIVPATYEKDVKETLKRFDAVVLMKVHRVFGKVLQILDEMNLTDRAVYVSRTGMDNEKVFRNIKEVREEDLNYFSTLIVKK